MRLGLPQWGARHACPCADADQPTWLRLLVRRTARGRMMMRRRARGCRRNHCGRLNAVYVWKVFTEVRITVFSDRALVGPLAIAAVDFLHDVHAGRNLGKRRKTHAIEPRVIAQIDEEL